MTPARFVSLLTLGLAALSLAAAEPELAKDFRDRANRLRFAGKAATALAEADSLLRLPELQEITPKRTEIETVRGLLLASMESRRAEAEAAYDEALTHARALGLAELEDDLLLKLAWLMTRTQRQAEADSLNRLVQARAQARNDRPTEARARMNFATRHLAQGDFESAQSELEFAVEALAPSSDRTAYGDANNLLGIVRVNRMQLEPAVQAFETARAVADSIGNTGLYARATNNLAVIYHMLGDTEASAAAFREAYDLQLKIGGDGRSRRIAGLNVAEAQIRLGQHAQAEELLQQLYADALAADDATAVFGALNNLGMNALSSEQWPTARHYYQQAARSSPDPEEKLRGYLGVSRALAEMDSVALALQVLERRALPLRSQAGGAWQLELDLLRANYQLRLGRGEATLPALRAQLKTADQNHLQRFRQNLQTHIGRVHAEASRPDSALYWYGKARDTWEQQREIPTDPQWRERRGEEGRGLHIQLAELQLHHGEGDSLARATQAFDTLQRYKARTLLERLHAPGWQFERGKSAEPVNLSILQGQTLRPGELLLDLYAGPEHSLMFAVTPDSLRWVVLPAEKQLRERLELLQGLLTSPTAQMQVVDEVLDRMGAQFLAPVRSSLAGATRVLYSPDGAMHLLPLGALRLDGKALIVDKDVVRLPSAAVLYELRQRAADDGGGRADLTKSQRWLALAGGSSDASDLRAAHGEVTRLHRRFADVELRLPNDEQGPSLELSELADYRLIHFAAHALVSDRQPWRSSLLLGGMGPGELRAASRLQLEEAGQLLRADQIAQLRLQAELVVLAACESAGGTVLSGEGVLGLTSAFLSAGVPVVIAALWPVDDAATAELMRHFYDRLAVGETVGTALRSAQLALIQSPATAHPFYWAGFVAVGDGSRSIELKAASGILRSVLIVMVLLLAIVLIWRLRRRGMRRR